jgi:hypothetical protein
MAHVEKAGQIDQEPADKAVMVNRISAIVMALAVAGVLLTQRPGLVLVFLSYVAISVFVMSFARSRGILVKPYRLRQQNLAAYVTVSTAGFFATLFGVPQLVELHGSMIFVLLAIVIGFLLLRAIVKSLRAAG